MPRYNDHRRGTPVIQSTYGTLKRSRSDPRLNMSFSQSCSDLSATSTQSFDSSTPSPSVNSQRSNNHRILQHNHQNLSLNESSSSTGGMMFRHPSEDSTDSPRSMSISSAGSYSGMVISNYNC